MAILSKKALAWGAGLVLIAGCGWFALPYVVDVNQYRGLIQDQLRTKLGRDVKLGPMELSVLPLSIRIRDFSIGEDPAVASSRPFATAKELRVRLGLFALLRKQVEVSSIVLDSPSVEIIRKADGKWNFSTLGASGGSSSESPVIESLTIADGAAGYTDLRDAKPERTQYDHIDIELTDYAPGRRFQLNAGAHLPGANKPSIEWSGNGTGPTDIAGKLKLANVTVDSLQTFLHRQSPADVDAVLTGEMDVRVGDASTAKGKLEISGLRVKKSKLEFPLALVLDARREKQRTQLDKLDIAVGASKFAVTGVVDGEQAKLHVETNNSPIDELLKLAAAFGAGADPSMKAAGKLSAKIDATGPLDKLALNGNIETAGLEVRNSKWTQPVRIADLRLALTPGEIRSTPFQIEAGGAKLTGNFKIANYTGDAGLDVDIRADNASLAGLLNVAQAFGAAAPDVTGTGTVDLDVHVQGPAKKPRYSGKANIDNAQLSVPGVNKPVAVTKLIARFEENGAAIEQFSANLAGSKMQGSGTIRNFEAPDVKFVLTVDKWNTEEMQKLFASNSGAAGGKKPSMFAKASGNGTVDIGSLAIDDLVLNQLHATCSLDRGVLTLEPLKAELFGGGINGRIVADLRPAAPEITVKARMALVDANKLMSAATPLKQTLFGKFNADADLKLTAGDDIAKSLNGAVVLNLADGKFAGLNLLNEISKFAKFFGWNAQQNAFTDFVRMGGTLRIVNGVAQTNDLDVEMNGARLSAAGTINLVAQTLDLRLGTVLDSEFSKKVGGSQIGGFMTTALADERGQLIIPSLLRGSFAKPVVSPDTEQFAKLKMKSLVNPASVQGAKDTVKGIVDLFKKKKE